MLAHAQLLQTDPAAGSLIASAPSEVTLVFSEPVTPAGFGIHVYSPSGGQVAGTVVQHGAVLTAPLDSVQPGTYVVLWQVFAADTHPSRGAFAYSVIATSANPYAGLLDQASAGTSTPLGVAMQALARWVHFIGFALVFGLVAYDVLTRRSNGSGLLVNAGLVMLIAAEPLALVAQLASLSFDGDTALAVLGSPFGRILGLRLGAALLAWTLIATDRAWPVLAVGAAIALLDGFTAHAIPNVPLLGQVLVAVHVSAMGLWVGGLVGFVRRPDRRFVRYAVATFGTPVGTGLVLALVHTRWLADLLTTEYGRALILKVAIVALAALAALVARRRLEVALAATAVGAATLVAALPPPS